MIEVFEAEKFTETPVCYTYEEGSGFFG